MDVRIPQRKCLFTAFLLLGLISFTLDAQVTFRIISQPDKTPPGADIYISGDFEGWSGGTTPYKLIPGPDSTYTITLPQMSGTIRFKFTQGAWDTVEKGLRGEELDDRTYVFGGNGDSVDIVIHNWSDHSGNHGASTAAANVFLFDEDLNMPQLKRRRTIWIYLPPDYETSDEPYPVLYMHDGQNLFDDSTSFSGEWGVDETLNTLYDATGFGLIVVGIENGDEQRIDEYSPWINPQYGGGEGEAYIAFISETLKPLIDNAFRTKPGTNHTGLMGSSMGGLISHYGALEQSEVFGKAAVFSPAFALFDSCYDYTATINPADHQRFYFLSGGKESKSLDVTASVRHMVDVMTDAGFRESQIHVTADPNGIHHESFWKGEFEEAIRWLFDVR